MSYYVREHGNPGSTGNTNSDEGGEVPMSWADSWVIAMAGYAILLAWPISTLVLVWFAVRYHGTHRAKTVNKAVAGGEGRPEHFWIIVPALNDLPAGCAFSPRCPFADAQCHAEYPPYEQKRPGHWAACWHTERLYGGKNG